jgi:hypothetical protein
MAASHTHYQCQLIVRVDLLGDDHEALELRVGASFVEWEASFSKWRVETWRQVDTSIAAIECQTGANLSVRASK